MRRFKVYIISNLLFIFLLFSFSPNAGISFAAEADNAEKKLSYDSGVFSWNEYPDDEQTAILKENGITEIYQFIDIKKTDEETQQFLSRMKENDITVYALEGGARWALSSSYSEMESFLSNIEEINNSVNRRERIKGVVLDVEPYGLDEWESSPEEVLSQYRLNIKKLKRDTELEICVCIPYSYDTTGLARELGKLIKASDQTFVMNYCKGSEIRSLQVEALFAKLLDKRLVNIYELQPVEITGYEFVTYHDEGLSEVKENFEGILSTYPGQEIVLAYHNLDYLIELSEDE